MDKRKKRYKKKEDTPVEKKRTVRTGKRVNLEESMVVKQVFFAPCLNFAY